MFLSLFSYKILNYKLYKHHYLCIIIISILNFIIIFIEVLLGENKLNNFLFFLKAIPVAALYSLELAFDKYLIFSKYINSYEILFFQGIIELILGVISLIIATKYDYIDNFFDFINKFAKKEIIILIVSILFNFTYYLLLITIIDILSPIHVLIMNYISNVIIIILLLFIGFINGLDKFVIIINSFFSFLSIILLLIFTEIIELNCFGLSYMTKRNIELRAQLDSIIDEDDKQRNETKIGLQEYIVELSDYKQEEKSMLSDTENFKEDG